MKTRAEVIYLRPRLARVGSGTRDYVSISECMQEVTGHDIALAGVVARAWGQHGRASFCGVQEPAK
jgi:hypothetical protein